MSNSLEELATVAENFGVKISDIVLQEQVGVLEKTEDEIIKMMELNLNVMLESIEKGCDKNLKSTSGLTGGAAYKMHERIKYGKAITGPIIATAIQMALAVAELNAAMGKIVASPTAGSCGILPAAVGVLIKEYGVSKVAATKALLTAGGIGIIIATNASISGAEGGCQAECGSASAMAAAAIVELLGGTPRMSINAAAIAMKCELGLVCDPVAGLVEVPCVKRNASGVSIAFTAAELSLAGIESVIPADEVVHAMKKVGASMPVALKETAEGGLAVTPTGKRIHEELFGSAPSGGGCTGCTACV